jgi:hypothetical protein
VCLDQNCGKICIKTNNNWKLREISIVKLEKNIKSNIDCTIHEYIPGFANQKLMIDIDCKYSDFKLYWTNQEQANVQMNEFQNCLIKAIQGIIADIYLIDVNSKDISVENGSELTENDWKFFYHIKLQKYAFVNLRESMI